MTTRSAWRWLRPAVVILLAAVVIGVPLWLVLATSAKPQGEAVRPNLDPPRQWQPAGNYADAYQEGEILRGLVNSLLVIVPSVVLVLLLGAAAAWVFARRKGRLVAAAYAVSLSGLLLPPAIITIVLLLRQLDLAGMVTQEYELSDINRGFEDMLAGRNIRGVLRYT